jgi:replication factor C large subunit
MKGSPFPMLITANNPWDKKFNSLRKTSILVEFKPLDSKDIFEVLKRSCIKESIVFEERALKSLARASGGDLRAALNDLELVSTNGKITKENLEVLTERDKTETILNGLLRVFKTRDFDIAVTAFDEVDEDFNQLFLWIEENLPKEYSGENLVNGFNALSKADIYYGRIRRRQYWRFLVYIRVLITAGIALAKKEKNPNLVKYEPTKRLLRIWMARNKLSKKINIASKIAQAVHSSSKRSLEIMDYFKKYAKYFPDEFLEEVLDLNKDEIKWIRN